MKKHLFFIFFLVAGAFIVNVNAQNVTIANPGFESDLTGWTVQNGSDGSNTITPVSATDEKYSGSNSLKFPVNYGSQITTEARVYQTITGLTPGNYTLSAYVKGKRWEKDNGIFANGGTGDVKEATDFNNPSNISNQFNLVSLSFTVDANGTAIIGGYASKRRSASDRANDFWIDDFQLSKTETDAGLMITFENTATNPTWSNTDNNPVASAEIITNADNEGLNTSEKAFFIQFRNNKNNAQWWDGINLQFKKAYLIDSENRYLHVMIKTSLSKFEFAFINGSKWNGSHTVSEKDVWFDYVVDLTTVKDGNLSGQNLGGFRIAVSDVDNFINKNICIDEIVLNNDPEPRISNIITDITVPEITGNIYAAKGSIIIDGISGVYNVYNMMGHLVSKGVSEENAEIKVGPGCYIILIDDCRQKVKVLVK